MINKLESKANIAYTIFRVVVGLLFAQHGAQKLFGWFGGTPADLISKMGLAGTIELIAGLLIAIGLWTRIAAVLGALDMIGAYITVHATQGLIPIVNNGELALLYLVCFLIIITHGKQTKHK